MKNFCTSLMALLVVIFFSTEASAQYCTPIGMSSTWDGVQSVSTSGASANFSNSTGIGATYTNYSGTHQVDARKGSSFTLTIRNSWTGNAWIDWNADGDFDDAGEDLNYWVSKTSSSFGSTSTHTVTVPYSAATATTRLRVGSGYSQYWGPCGNIPSWSGRSGEFEDYAIDILPPPPNDAGVARLKVPTICSGTNDLDIVVFNYGSDTLSSVQIEGSFAGTTYGPTTVSGLSVPPGSDTILTLGQYTAISGNSYTINARTRLPNGVADGDSTNDAMTQQTLSPAMSGSFTIDPSGGGDYTSFSAALSDLYANGVCDTVWMNVLSGTYSGRITVGGITGASEYSPVIFRSDTGNTTNPVLTNSGDPLEFDDSWWVTFDGFDINTTSNFSDVIYFDDDNNNITIQNCNISKPQYNSTSSSYALVRTSTSSADRSTDISFINNTFTEGSYGIYCYGTNGQRNDRWTLMDNTFEDQYYRTVYFYYSDELYWSGNDFGNVRYTSFMYGTYVYYSDHSIIDDNDFNYTATNNYGYANYWYYMDYAEVTNNRFNINTGNSYRYGIRMQYSDYAYIADNEIELTGSNGGYGMYTYQCYESLVERNVITLSNSGYSYGMWHYYPEGSSGNPFIVRNNIINQTQITGSNTRGIILYYPDYHECLHNTVRIRSAYAQSTPLYVYEFGTAIDANARNNIFMNEGTGPAVYQRVNTSLSGRDNNIYWTNGACLGDISGCKATLADLQNAPSGSDMGSIVHEVDFFGASDLHVFYDKVINDAGSAAATIVPEDFDGESRDPLNPDPGMDEFQVPQNSVSLVSIDNPSTPLCGTVTDYDVTIFNVGTGNLDSFNVNGVVNHLGGGSTPLATYQHAPSGGVASGATASFNVGSLTGGFSNGDTLVLWVTEPNGVIDSILIDDTLSIGLTDGLFGTFTIGDTSIGTYDYASLRHAQTLLDSVGAICDTVTFLVAPGNYAGMEIPYLVGTGTHAPVVITSTSSDPDSVTITQPAGVNSAVTLAGASNVVIDGVTLSGNNGGNALNVWGDGENLIVMDSKLRSNSGNTSVSSSVVYVDGQFDNMYFAGNRIGSGSYGMYIVGNSGSDPATGLSVMDNEFVDNYYMGLYARYIEDVDFSYNEIESNSSYTNGYGIYFRDVDGRIDVVENHLNSDTDWPRYGIYANTTSGSSNFPANFENNVIKLGYLSNTNSLYGIYGTNCDFFNVNHNTFVIEGTGGGATAAYFAGGGGNELTNNIFANMGTGYAIYISGTFTVINSNNNDLYSGGNNLGYFNQATFDLNSWQSVSGLDGASVSEDPGFYSMSDLRVCSDSLDGRGRPTGVMYDFEGETRDVNNPDIGADEFTAPSNFSLPADTTICQGDVITLNASLNSGTFAIWNNFQPNNSFTISSPGIYKAFVANTCGQAIDSIEVFWADPVQLSADTHLCAGESFVADAGIASANGMGATYNWSTGASSQTITIGNRGIYTVVVNDNIGCTSTDTITVTQSRAVSLPADTSFCDGNTYVVNANVGAGNYFWSPTGSTGPVVFINKTGNYKVSYTDNMSCTSTDEIDVDVILVPVADFTYFSSYRAVAFTDLSSDASTYMWSFGDGDTSYAANPAHIYPAAGTYTVTQYVENDCGEDLKTQRVTIQLVGLEDVSDNEGISLFPNPNSGMFDLVINGVEDQDLNVKVVTLDGKIVFDTEVVNSGVTELNIDLGNVSSGVYFVRVQGETYSAVEKVTIK
jgi:hypothetical protein